MHVSRIVFCAAFVLTAALAPACSRAPSEQAAQETPASPQTLMEERAGAIIAALSSGDPQIYEAAARKNYAADFYAARTPDERAQFANMIFGDFGRLEIGETSFSEGVANYAVTGANGPAATFIFFFDDTPERRITRIEISAEDGDGESMSDLNMPPPPINADMTGDELEAAIDGWLAPIIENDDFSGVILIARNGALLLQKAYGLADRVTAARIDADTAFNIASIGKKFTQIAIARLIEEDRLSLETTVGDVLPDYPVEETRRATIRQLIEMQGGVSDFFGPAFEILPKRQFASNHDYYEFVSSLPARFAPGEGREYCNGCYIVLGEIAERIVGEPFEDYIQKTVFDPAGMTRTGYFSAHALPENCAQPYGRDGGPGSPYVNMQDRHGDAGSGAGGAYSTALDLLALDNALRNGLLLNPDMTTWALGGDMSDAGRNDAPMGIAGGADGTNAILESTGEWAVIVTANVSPPLPEQLALALAREILR